MDKIAIIGPGRVGKALAIGLQDAGVKIAGILGKGRNSVQNFAENIGCGVFADEREVVLFADVVIIAVPDREITHVVDRLARVMPLHSKKVVIHTCGSQSAENLACLSPLGVSIGSMHPLQTFSTVELSRAKIKGTYFAVDGDEKAVGIIKFLVDRLGGKVFAVDSDCRPLYHAAACMASNYMVGVVHGAVQMMRKLGIEEQDALFALKPILNGTLENVFAQGTVKSLTGPIARGDEQTIVSHLTQIHQLAIEEEDIYRAMGVYTLNIAQEQGNLSKMQIARLNKVLLQSRET